MKLLHLVKKDPTPTEQAILEAQKKLHEVAVVDLRSEKDYGAVVDRIFASDKVISW